MSVFGSQGEEQLKTWAFKRGADPRHSPRAREPSPEKGIGV